MISSAKAQDVRIDNQEIVLPSAHALEEGSWISRNAEGLTVLACGIFLVAAWALEGVSASVAIVLYLAAFLAGGYAKAKEGLITLIQERDLDVNLLMIIAAIGAACIGYWKEGAVLIFIFALSGALESYTMDRSRREISALVNMKPESALLVKDGVEQIVPVEQLAVHDIVIVKPGSRIPADGTVREGISSVNQSSITGESMPVDKKIGDEVFAGTMNGQGAMYIEVTRPGEATLFAKIIRLVQEAQSEQPASQRFMEGFERIYARIVLLVAVLLIFAPPLLFSWSWDQSLYKAMVFLVVASPCALVASIMPAVLSAISSSARRGVLFKGGAHLENLARTKVVAFDKTGTLTTGKPEVTDLIALDGFKEEEILCIAAALERMSEHPLAKSIVAHAQQAGSQLQTVSDFKELTGWGIEAKLEGRIWRIGKPAFLPSEFASPSLLERIAELEQEGKTVTILHNEQGAAGILALRDSLRPDARQAVERLKQEGVKVAMLSGDQRQTADAIAREAGIDLVYAELLPDDKVNRIKELREKYGAVAMVGDGVNDAPALAAATVGIAMGAAGSDAALETANLVLLKDDIGLIAGAIRLGRRTAKVVRQNMIFALSVIILLILSNFITGIALPLGVVGHEGSTILVILSGLRLLRQGRDV